MLKPLIMVSFVINVGNLYAGSELKVVLENIAEAVEVSNVQLIYHSSDNWICGKWRNGSVTNKKHFVDYKPNSEINASKELKRGICTYKLSNVTVLGPNYANNDVEYISLPILNEYSHSVLRSRPVSTQFNFLCENTEAKYGCEGEEAIGSLENDEVSILIQDH